MTEQTKDPIDRRVPKWWHRWYGKPGQKLRNGFELSDDGTSWIVRLSMPERYQGQADEPQR